MRYRKHYLLLTVTVASIAVTAPAQTDDETAALFQGVTLTQSLKPRFTDGNPLMTQAFHADPYAITYNDTMYVFGSDDTPRVSDGTIQTNNYSGIRNVALVSSGDLVNWTHHPRIRAASLSGGAAGLSWAPAVAYKEIGGKMKFFLYISDGGGDPVPGVSGEYRYGGIAVLSADHPKGSYTSARNGQLIDRNTPLCKNVKWLFDPGVLVDDDGKAYIYFGGGIPSEDLPNHGTLVSNYQSDEPDPGTLRVAELAADMVSIVPGSVKVFPVPFLFEAAQINKIGGTYYFSYCSNFRVEHFANRPQQFPEAVALQYNGSIAYMTSSSPTTGFTLGNNPTILRNPSNMFSGTSSGNNHHSIVEFKGGHYIVYHSLLLRNYLNHPPAANGMGGYRSTHIDPVTINTAAKTISRVTGSTSGAPQVGRYNPYVSTNAATMANMAGITTTAYRRPGMSDSLMRVSDIHTGDWVALRGVDFGNGMGSIEFTCRVTPPSSGFGAIQIRAGTPGNNFPAASTAVGYVRIVPGQSEYTVDLPETVTGVKDVAFVFYGEGWHFEEWRFAEKGETSVHVRDVGADPRVRPSVSVRGRTLNISSPNNSALTIRMIDVRGKVAARFVGANCVRPQSFPLTNIPAGRYFVDVRGAGVRQTLSVVVK